MKKLILIMATALLLSISGNCQWYNRRYGVKDINQLSQEQLNESLIKAKKGVTVGRIISGLGAIGIVSGIIMASYDSPYAGDIGRNVGGILLLIGSIPTEITGLTIWNTNALRKKSIKEVLKSTELKMGLVNYQKGNMLTSSEGYIFPCLSVTISF